MMSYLHKRQNLLKSISLSMLILFINTIVNPTVLYASVSSPNQEEYQAFEPATTNQMVNPFTGNFIYNIPLLSVGNYPINISYHDQIKMDQEASWVGLGWSLNAGSLNKQIRGIPDDFRGDKIRETLAFKKNKGETITKGYGVNVGFSIFSADQLNVGAGISASGGISNFYNTYQGVGFGAYFSPYVSVGVSGYWVIPNTPISLHGSLHGGVGADFSFNTQSGIGINPKAHWGLNTGVGIGKYPIIEATNVSSAYSLAYTTRRGLTEKRTTNTASFLFWELAGTRTISYGTPTYVPSIPFNSFSFSKSASRDDGVNAIPINAITLGANRTKSESVYEHEKIDETIETPSYGYLYEEHNPMDGSSMYDFNREQERSYMPATMPNLPVTNHTNDFYMANAQGLNSNYRPYRNDFGFLSMPDKRNFSLAFSEGKQRSYGLNVSWNNSFGFMTSDAQSGGINDNSNVAKNKAFFKERIKDFEPFSFMKGGELNVSNHAYYSQFLSNYASRFTIDSKRPTFWFLNYLWGAPDPFKYTIGSEITNEIFQDALPLPNNTNKLTRDPRKEVFSFLSAIEADKYGLEKDIKSYSLNETNGVYSSISRVTPNKIKEHHISEASVIKSDGSKYVYGIPVYNNFQNNVSFNVSNGDNQYSNICEGLIGYSANSDDATGNNNGEDHFYNEVAVPANTQGHLLTAVLSPDYVDLTGDGPTEDDLGTYTKFNYTKTSDSFGWRYPQQQNKAIYNPGFISENEDDKASFSYGAKELWYLNSIECKNYIAEFNICDREDGASLDRHGNRNNLKKLKKLTRIDLYTKEEKRLNPSNPIPLKSVHFTYSYELCPSYVGNNGGTDKCEADNTHKGKLTLKKIHFTYGDSKKGRLSPYQFKYNEASNYPYRSFSQDRWGTYKPYSCSPSNQEFPYSEQSQVSADKYSESWALSQIIMPSGATVEIERESDDYAYVQNKSAARMMKIHAFNFLPIVPSKRDELYSIFGKAHIPHPFLIIKLDKPIQYTLQGKEKFKSDYLQGINHLYFKSKVNLHGNDSPEYILGYTSWVDAGLVAPPSGQLSQYAWIKLPLESVTDPKSDEGPKWFKNIIEKDKKLKNAKVNPITKAAWQYTRLNREKVIWPELEGEFSSVPQSFDDIDCNSIDTKNLEFTEGWLDALGMDKWTLIYGGLNKALLMRNYGRIVELNSSWVRLHDSDKKKLGGGSRVKTIKTYDGWNSMTSNLESSYGQEYLYQTKEGYSSGVAAYEPFIGNDENPFKEPIFYNESNVLAPDNHHYLEEPLGESFYPAPVVGYSRVVVKSIKQERDQNSDDGYLEYEHYTAKDFPSKSNRTKLEKEDFVDEPNYIRRLINATHYDYLSLSQGYSVEVNNMHGKLKSIASYKTDETLVSKTSYEYFKTGNASDKLLNTVPVVKNNGSINNAEIGQTMDMVADSKFSNEWKRAKNITKIRKVGLGGITWKTSHYKENYQTIFKSSVLTKVIHKHGILKSVNYFNNGSSTSIQNLAFDAENGDVLVRSVTNEYSNKPGLNDRIFSINYPAKWGYDNMRGAYSNIGALVTNLTQNFVYEGDVIGLANGEKGWVVLDGNTKKLIDKDGNFISLSGEGVIIQSGRRNLLNASMQNITTLDNPVWDESTSIPTLRSELTINEVLNGSATTFSDEWQTRSAEPINCNTTSRIYNGKNFIDVDISGEQANCVSQEGDVINPYMKGIKGTWRPEKQLIFDGERESSTDPRTRTDGIINAFTPYWDFDGGSLDVNPLNWITASSIDVISPNGHILQATDIIGNSSAALYGYNQSDANLLTAAANNAHYTSIGYDGFEDYFYNSDLQQISCQRLSHWSFIEGVSAAMITNEEYHTGNKSIKLQPGEHHSMVRNVAKSSSINVPNPIYSNKLEKGESINIFNPISARPGVSNTFLISGWIKVKVDTPVETYDDLDSYFEVTKHNSGTSTSSQFKPKGPIIEGWQRFEGEINITNMKEQGGCLEFSMVNLPTNPYDVYFDDLRIHPIESEMKSFVYDQSTLRLIAELDDYNYATYYEYDEEGRLIRTKRETEKGILTINEARTSLKKLTP